MPDAPMPEVAVVGALYTGAERGLAADLGVARALGLSAQPVCTALVMASRGHVTEVTEVPADAIRAAFEHIAITEKSIGLKVGALGTHQAVEAVFRAAEHVPGPIVLDFIASGPSGETVLTARGISALIERMGRADLVVLRRRDAELVTGGEIRSLDDAQVAAQRAVRRGARSVLIRCGTLPARFFNAEDPGAEAAAGAFMVDLYYDGEDFALFEAPRLALPPSEGASSALTVAILRALVDGQELEEAVRFAKRYTTEALRHGTEAGGVHRLNFYWDHRA